MTKVLSCYAVKYEGKCRIASSPSRIWREIKVSASLAFIPVIVLLLLNMLLLLLIKYILFCQNMNSWKSL